ncbi:MAG: ACT domain-containing protein [Clostridia bacterium]|nr:ACT domain-containing protein [Clostridia bacterium]MBR7041646.1 ACT domain-containing protein [Clostridia bacterium]MCR4577316.1 ACT domain-containing protein [Clostridiales bacterium]
MVRQISVFLENKAGALAQMTRVLADNGINLRAFSLAEASDFGIARLIVNDVYLTSTVLKENGFVLAVANVLAVAMPDAPGGLAGVLECLKDANVNVEYIYAFTSDKPGQAYMILRPDDETAAMKALRGAGIRQVEQEELSEM